MVYGIWYINDTFNGFEAARTDMHRNTSRCSNYMSPKYIFQPNIFYLSSLLIQFSLQIATTIYFWRHLKDWKQRRGTGNWNFRIFTPQNVKNVTWIGLEANTISIYDRWKKPNSNISTPRGIPRIKLMQKEKFKYNKLTWKM